MNLVRRRVIGTTHACGGLVDGPVPVRRAVARRLDRRHQPRRRTPAAPDAAARSRRADVESFLRDGREAFPRADLDRGDVRLVHRGLLPMLSAAGRTVRSCSESDGRRTTRPHGVPGLMSIFSVRYTTARHTAERRRRRGRSAAAARDAPPCRTADDAVAGGDHHEPAALVRPHGLAAGTTIT